MFAFVDTEKIKSAAVLFLVDRVFIQIVIVLNNYFVNILYLIFLDTFLMLCCFALVISELCFYAFYLLESRSRDYNLRI